MISVHRPLRARLRSILHHVVGAAVLFGLAGGGAAASWYMLDRAAPHEFVVVREERVTVGGAVYTLRFVRVGPSECIGLAVAPDGEIVEAAALVPEACAPSGPQA